MVHVYTGDGKGKTTASCGLALRAAGRRKRVLFIQFLKGRALSGELFSMKKIPFIEVKKFGKKGFVRKTKIGEADLKMISRWIEFVEGKLTGKGIDMVVLDEINVAMDYGLVDVEKVLNFIKKYGKKKEIVLTGRRAPQKILKIADYVTEMKVIRHPFQKGVKARRGIEY